MNTNKPIHLLSSTGILASFSIAKRISKEDVDKAKFKARKIYKGKDPKKIQELISDILVSETKEFLSTEIPPGFIFPKVNVQKDNLDKFYLHLSIISQTLAKKFVEQKLNKHQVCFIVNAIVNILGIKEEDFEEFYKKYSKYRNDDFSED